MDGARRPWDQDRFQDLGAFEKTILVVYAVADAAFPFVVVGGGFLALAGFRGGAYLLVVGLIAQFASRDLLAAMSVRRDGELEGLRPFERGVLTLGFGCCLVAFVAAGAAVWGSRSAAYLAVAGVFASFVAHLVVSVSNYARVMARTWPAVRSLGPEDDDDW